MTLKPESPASIRQQALVEVKALRQAGKHAESLAALELVLQKLPWHPELEGHMSEGLRRVGLFDQALQVVNDAIEKRATAWLYRVKSSNLVSMGDYDAALDCLDAVPEKFKSNEKIKKHRINLMREQALIEVKALRKAGLHAESLAMIESLLEKLPWHPKLAGHLSEGLRHLGNSEKSLEVINEAIEREPTIWLYRVKSSNLVSMGDYKTALATLNDGLKFFANNLSLLIEKAHLFFSQGRLFESVDVLCHSSIPDSFSPRLILLARVEFQLGNREKSFEIIAEKSNKDLPCATVYAELLRRSGRSAEALSFIRQSFIFCPDWAFRIEEARCLKALGNEDELEKLLNSWQHFDDLPKAYYQLAIDQAQKLFNYFRVIELAVMALRSYRHSLQFYRPYLDSAIKLGEAELTLTIMETLSGKYADKAVAQRIQAAGWSQMGENWKALECIRRSVDLDPINIGGYTQYVDKLILLGQSEGALQVLNNCPEDLKKNENILCARAKIYWSQGRYKQAVHILKKLEMLSHLQPKITIIVIEYLLQLGFCQEAKVVLKKMDPGVVGGELQYALALAKIHVEERDLLAAIATLESYITRQSPSEVLLYRLAQLKLAKGDIGGADRAYKAAVALKFQKNKVQAKKYTPTMLGQQINEFKLLSHDLPSSDYTLLPVQQLDKAVDNSLLAITLIRRMYELDRFPTNIINFDQKCERTIPLKIFQYWNNPFPPEEIQKLTETCRTVNSDCEYTLFHDTSALNYLKEKELFQSARAFKAAQSPATKADILRLALLWCEGGIYLDADDLCLSPFSEHINPEAEIYLYLEPNVYSLGNNFMASKPKSLMMEEALKEAEDNVLTSASESTWFSTGPALLTRHFVSHYLTSKLTLKDGAVVLLMPELRRFLAHHQRLMYKTTDKHWVHAFADKKWNAAARILN